MKCSGKVCQRVNKLTVLINSEQVFEFDRDLAIDEEKLAFFERMDADMNKGIRMHGKLMVAPDTKQKARFVVMNLIKALQQENQAVISVSCAYLLHHFPALIEIQANDDGDSINIELVEE